MQERSIRKTHTLILGLTLALFASFASAATTIEAYGKLPLSFEPNYRQTSREVEFLSRGSGYTLFLTANEAVLTLRKSDSASNVVRMRVIGANRRAPVTGVDALPGRSNYLIGNDPSKWRTDIPNYAKVRYQNIYRGIDLIYYGHQRQLEYDFVVAPHTDPTKIQLGFEGAKKLAIDETGDLIVDLARLHKPIAYQERDGKRIPVPARYVLGKKHRVRFEVATYDRSKPLIIDPVLVYSTYLGGSGDERAFGIAVDASGNAYVTGRTSSVDFPTTPAAFDTTLSGAFDAFVTKLNATGSALVYSTYLGGSRDASDAPTGDTGLAIAVDGSGSAYVTGVTFSPDFPTTPGAFDTTFDGVFDGFATKLNASGSALIYSTFIAGSSGGSAGRGITVDSSGNAYVAGDTSAADFPTTPGAFDTTFDQDLDIFVAKLNASGSALVYSTFLGSAEAPAVHNAFSIAVDALGNSYVTGRTSSSQFPTTPGAFDSSFSGGFEDAFVTKLNAAGSALMYSTYLGGSGNEEANGIAVDSAGNAYVTGYTYSTDFPVSAAAFDPAFNGVYDAFVTKFSPTGSLVYSTYIGGIFGDIASAIAVDSAGNSCITGGTESSDFPSTDPGSASHGAFITKLNSTGSAVLYSTALGGMNGDIGSAIALDSFGDAYVTGSTMSPDFPTTPGAFDTTFNNSLASPGFDAFVTKLLLVPSPEQLLINLAKLITSFSLLPGMESSLLAKVQAAQDSLARDDRKAACNQLNALINETAAQSGKKLGRRQAQAIIDAAQAIRNALRCR